MMGPSPVLMNTWYGGASQNKVEWGPEAQAQVKVAHALRRRIGSTANHLTTNINSVLSIRFRAVIFALFRVRFGLLILDVDGLLEYFWESNPHVFWEGILL